jgi:hypothetical protein
MLKKGVPADFNYVRINKLGPETLFEKDYANSLESNQNIISFKSLDDDVWIFESQDHQEVLDKLEIDSVKLKSFANPCTGLTSGKDKIFILNRQQVQSLGLEKELLLPVVRGRNISRFYITDDTDYVIYPYRLNKGETELISEEEIKEDYPKLFSYFEKHRKELGERKDSRKLLSDTDDWYKLIRKGKLDLFQSQKILTPGISKENRFAIDHNGYTYLCGGAGVFGLIQEKYDIYYLTALLNSKVVEFFLHSISTKKQGGYYSYLNSFLEQIPIPNKFNEGIVFKSKTNETLRYELILQSNKFTNYIKLKFGFDKISNKLENWQDIDFITFIKELNKSTKANNKLLVKDGSQEVAMLTKKDEFEWLDLFEENKQKVQDLQLQIDQTDKEIDAMVYELYGLTEEEIEVIENS